MSIIAASIFEFTALAARGTLRIPLRMNALGGEATAAPQPQHLVQRTALPISKQSGCHQAIAPANGTVGSVAQTVLFSGRMVPSIEFVCDDSPNSPPGAPDEPRSDEQLQLIQQADDSDLNGWIERLGDAGIHADRTDSPDLLGQLLLATSRPVDAVICNLLDSDPAAPLNAALAARYPEEIVAGLTLIAKITGASRSLVCSDQRVTSRISGPIRSLIRKSAIKWISMSNDYPQSEPTLLLYTVLNRRLRPGTLPADEGVIVLDAAAAWAVGKLAIAGEAMTSVPILVRDHARKQSHLLLAPIGMPLPDLLERLGLAAADSLFRGGALLRDVVLPVGAVVSGSELILHVCEPEPDINPDACIRCGWCNEACPTRVQPAMALEAAQRNSTDLGERAGIDACIECGICSYVCPSRLPLLQGIRRMRAQNQR